MSDFFQVKEVSTDQWDGYWQRCPKTNLLQSWQYGAAKEQSEGWRPVRVLISDGAGQPTAMAQLLTRTLPLLGGIARLNRGPLFLVDIPQDQSIKYYRAVLQSLLYEARRRRWWVVQIAPEISDSEAVRRELQSLGLRRQPKPAWASGRLALTADEKTLLMGLDGKWRNCMRKGCRLGVSVIHNEGNLANTDKLVRGYLALQQRNNFKGLSETFLRILAGQTGAAWQFNQFFARGINTVNDDEYLGMLVTVRHGDSATYLIGASNDRGRRMQANSVLLWEAILHAKKAGCTWFDIGGLSENTPTGVAEFKRGLKAVPYGLVGEWRWYYRPW